MSKNSMKVEFQLLKSLLILLGEAFLFQSVLHIKVVAEGLENTCQLVLRGLVACMLVMLVETERFGLWWKDRAMR